MNVLARPTANYSNQTPYKLLLTSLSSHLKPKKEVFLLFRTPWRSKHTNSMNFWGAIFIFLTVCTTHITWSRKLLRSRVKKNYRGPQEEDNLPPEYEWARNVTDCFKLSWRTNACANLTNIVFARRLGISFKEEHVNKKWRCEHLKLLNMCIRKLTRMYKVRYGRKHLLKCEYALSLETVYSNIQINVCKGLLTFFNNPFRNVDIKKYISWIVHGFENYAFLPHF